MAGLAICSIVRCLRTSVNGLNPGSTPAYLRRRITAAALRPAGTLSSNKVLSPV
jgi:hypothetical protein